MEENEKGIHLFFFFLFYGLEFDLEYVVQETILIDGQESEVELRIFSNSALNKDGNRLRLGCLAYNIEGHTLTKI